jgi:hypothetical protein
MDIIKTPQDNIEAFLYNEINIKILEEYGDFNKRSPELLDFFNLLFTEFGFFIENAENYLSITDHFSLRNNYYPASKELENNPELVLDRINLYLPFIELLDFHYPKEKREGVFLKSCEHIEEVLKMYDFFLTDKTNKGLENEGADFRISSSIIPAQFAKIPAQSQNSDAINETTPIQRDNTLQWQGSELEFAELVKALIMSKKLNPELPQNKIFERMKQFFNVKDFSESDKLKEIRSRTNTPTPLINVLEIALTNWIDSKVSTK